MIGRLAKDVATNLRSRKFPYPVAYGPERLGHDGFRNAIVFRRDRESGDEIVPPKAANDQNPEVFFNRWVGGVFIVYARSSEQGADVEDHEEECDRVCDGVLVAMHRVLAVRKLPYRITESKLLTRDELRVEADDGGSAADDHSGRRSADAPGCAARVRFAVRTAVPDLTYPGAAQPVGNPIADVATELDVSQVAEAAEEEEEEDP